MRLGERIVGLVVCGGMMVALTGCVALDEHRRLQASYRNVMAEKEAMAGELFDARSTADSLRVRVDAMNDQMMTKDSLVSNLRSEAQLLDEMRQLAVDQLEKDMDRGIGAISIVGPKLPAPLDSALKKFAQAHPNIVAYDAQRGTVKFKSDLLFALGSDVVKESSLGTLKHFTQVLKSQAASQFEVIVVGHTDTTPIKRSGTKAKHPTNWHLSTHRAIAVSNALQQNAYPPTRIGVMGCGEYRPIAPNDTQANKSKNRRVDIYLVPTGSIVQGAIPSPTGGKG